MKKSEKMLLGLLVVVVIYFVVDLFILGSEDDPADPVARVDKVNERQPASSSNNRKEKVQAASLDMKFLERWKRDPFLGSFNPDLIDSLQGNIPYVLKAIAWRGKTAHVLINDDIFKLGIEKNGFLVSEVRDSSVVFLKDSQRYILKLGDTHE